ncbi:MAG: hypothetical protein MJ196_04450 [Treponemataceae bacterium]|nr:hypothetical protein [Treponemataceae bacterium]
MKYTIGLVDDDQNQLSDIRAVIKKNNSKEVDIEFKTYDIEKIQGSSFQILFDEILTDILLNNIQSLIIDNKIVNKSHNIEGVALYDKIKNVLSDFPIIVLTNLPEDSKKPDFVDSDKVYTKALFLKIKEDYSKEKVSNIINSMIKYTNTRDNLNVQLKDCQKELEYLDMQTNTEVSERKIETTSKIIEIERKLSKYVPLEITQADLSFTKEKIENIMLLINEANKLIGE